jgi:hypothetical protein
MNLSPELKDIFNLDHANSLRLPEGELLSRHSSWMSSYNPAHHSNENDILNTGFMIADRSDLLLSPIGWQYNDDESDGVLRMDGLLQGMNMMSPVVGIYPSPLRRVSNISESSFSGNRQCVPMQEDHPKDDDTDNDLWTSELSMDLSIEKVFESICNNNQDDSATNVSMDGLKSMLSEKEDSNNLFAAAHSAVSDSAGRTITDSPAIMDVCDTPTEKLDIDMKGTSDHEDKGKMDIEVMDT